MDKKKRVSIINKYSSDNHDNELIKRKNSKMRRISIEEKHYSNLSNHPESPKSENFLSFATKSEILTVIENFKKTNDSMICLTGEAFEYFLKHYREENSIKNEFLTRSKSIRKNIKVAEGEDEFKNLFNKLGDLLSFGIGKLNVQ